MRKIFLQILKFILRTAASAVLRLKKPEILAITGSCGKTTTKEAIFQILKTKFGKNVWKSYGNLNNEVGLPLAILGFKRTFSALEYPFVLIFAFCKLVLYFLKILPYPKILVLEMAADKPGDIGYLVSFTKPKIGLITNIGPAHLEAFETIENVAKEKSKIIQALPKDGLAILGSIDEEKFHLSKKTKAIIKFFSQGNDNLENILKILAGFYQIDKDKIGQILATLKPIPGRQNIIEGKNETLILDDSYNSNPLSCALALEKLQKLALKYQTERKIVVLGDMLELGNSEKFYHQQIGKLAKRMADIFVGVGLRMKAGRPQFWFKTPMEAASFLLKRMKNKDIILVKGSQGMRMEKIVKELIAQPKLAKKLLVRQNFFWKIKPFKNP